MTTNYMHPVSSPDDSFHRIDIFESKSLVMPRPGIDANEIAMIDYDPYLNGAAALHFGANGISRLSFLHGLFPQEGAQRPRWLATIINDDGKIEIYEAAYDSRGQQLTNAKDIERLRPDFKKLIVGLDPEFAKIITSSFGSISNFVHTLSPYPHWEFTNRRKPTQSAKTAA